MWPFINNYDEVTKERLKLSEDVPNGDFYSSLVHKKNTTIIIFLGSDIV